MKPAFAWNGQQRRPITLRVGAALGLLIAFLALGAGLRIVALDADPYRRLDWSSGLLTDEGFYLHNARNFVLFGRERTDDFNNALLSPTLNRVQIVVFQTFGIGRLPARCISLAAGLLTLPLFFAALRRAYGLRVATVGVVFLGFDHLPLLYSRMALMDTPAALVLVAAFYGWGRAFPGERREKQAGRNSSFVWLGFCGAALGFAFATRGLCAFLVPVPLGILFFAAKRDRAQIPRLFAFGGGLLFALAFYVVFWYLPNHAEIARINAFYLQQQILPRSSAHLARLFTRSVFGDTRGLAPALVRHSPVLLALSLAGIFWRLGKRRELPPLSMPSLFLGGWLLAAWLTFSVIGYAPSRYYILFFPAFAAVAALAADRLPEIGPYLYIPNRTRVIFGSFFIYHAALAIQSFRGAAGIAFVALSVLFAAGFLRLLPRIVSRFAPKARALDSRRLLCGSLLLWAIINGVWLQDWLRHLSYAQSGAENWLTANLPHNAVLIGDAAPGLSVNTRFPSVPVIPGLCNDAAPLERFASRPRAIVILDGDRRETWWDRNYPALVRPERRIAFFPDAVGFPVGVYFVPPAPFHAGTARNPRDRQGTDANIAK